MPFVPMGGGLTQEHPDKILLLNFMNYNPAAYYRTAIKVDGTGQHTSRSILAKPCVTEAFSFPSNMPRPSMWKSMLRRSQKFKPIEEHLINPALNDFIFGIVQRLGLSMESHALGIYIYYGVVLRKRGYFDNQLLSASVSMHLASKFIERDTAIVSLSNLKKAACNYIPKEEYAKAEKNILYALEFTVEIDTFVAFLYYYLWSGVIFYDEQRVEEMQLLYQKILNKAAEYIRTGKCLCYEQHKVATYIVVKSRKYIGLAGWRDELRNISGISYEYADDIQEQLSTIDMLDLSPLRNQNGNMSRHKYLILKKRLDVALSVIRTQSPQKVVRYISPERLKDSSIRRVAIGSIGRGSSIIRVRASKSLASFNFK